MDSKVMEDFYEAWYFIDKHPDFAPFGDGGVGCLYVEVVKVNPETETIEDNDSLNTAVRVWLEGGPWINAPLPDEEEYMNWSHDIDLDCGAPTYEEAIIKFAENVKNKYGDYEEEQESNKPFTKEDWENLISSENEKKHLGPFNESEPPIKRVSENE
jgi:hypothetical protein